MNSGLPSCVRLRLLDFLIQSAHQLQVRPIVKYSALSLFSDRFCPSLSRSRRSNVMESWLLHPLRESNLQLFSLVSIWISSKIHDSQPLSVKSLKLLGDKNIKEQHFTTRDFLEAEVQLMQVFGFEIGTANIAFKFLEELFIEFEGVARVGQLVNFEASMDIMDLLYEKEETSTLYYSPRNLAASILVATYVVTVPKQKQEFPVLPWVKFVTSCNEEDVLNIVKDILKHIFEPSSVVELQATCCTAPFCNCPSHIRTVCNGAMVRRLERLKEDCNENTTMRFDRRLQ